MAKCTTESWKIKEIVNALSTMSHNGKKIVIPRFQRGKRWKENQELTFIDSLKRGYPVGTLLFYRTNEIVNGNPVEVYTLVDGLQRSTAISRYMKEPMKYYSRDSISSEMLDKIYDVLGFVGQEKAIKTKVSDIYYDYITNLKSFDGENSFDLAQKIASEIATTKDTLEVIKELMAILPQYLNICKIDYETIADTEIPAVVYTGEEEDLPEIFSRINSQGTPLNPFEIYAASWPQAEKFEVKNTKIIDNVLKKYDTLNDDVYTIRGYDRGEISQNRRLTIFEYVFGLSKWLNQEFQILAFETKNRPDEISTIGFELLDACLFDSKNIGDLHKELKKYNINKLEKRIVEAIKFVEGIITPITKFKGNSRKNEHSILYAKNQILAMIAFVFREKYDVNNLNCERERWHTNEEKLKRQLYDYFIFDIIQKEWFEGGGKIHTAINSKKYYDEITPSAWELALNAMFEESLKKKETKSVRNPSNIDIVFLNAIYVSKFSALDQLSSGRFDIEHIATKDIMKRLISETCPDDDLEGLPIGSIANLCYLPEYQNRAKGNKTFYQDTAYLHGLTLSEIEDKYSFTTKSQLDWVDLEYEKGDFSVLAEFYITFLKKRFATQKQRFYKAMNIDSTKIVSSETYHPMQTQNITFDSRQVALKDNSSGIEQQNTYELIRKCLEKKYGENIVFIQRTIAVGDNCRFILAYSKLYMQGKRHKYWFAYRPEKIMDGSEKNKYYVFACKEDNVSFSIPIEDLDANKNRMNSSKDQKGKLYYHVVFFVDEDKEGNKCMTWLLSRPKISERDIKEYIVE